MVEGTRARWRTIPWPLLSPRQFADVASKEPQESKIAVIFGREQSGLTNDELHRCHFHIQIQSNPDYSSLNLAAAVQIIAYELRVTLLDNIVSVAWDYPLAGAKEMEGFYDHLQQVLVDTNFLDPKAPRQLMTRIRRLFQRARPDVMEVNILRGILGTMDKNICKQSNEKDDENN